MHLRLSNALGTAVADRLEERVQGSLSGLLIDPDSGKIEGVYVKVRGIMGSENLFCSSADILSWGKHISISSSEVLSPSEDRVRLRKLVSDPRKILGQKVIAKSGARLGRCKDIQFDTQKMRLTWIFPKRIRWGVPIPVSDIIEVTQDAIIVRDPERLVKNREIKPSEALEKLKEIAEPGIVKPC